MTILENLVRAALLAAAALVLSGCLPSAQSQLEEEKEPHFVRGKSRVSELDYRGAIESFEKALEVNPQSASAHFELGCLFGNKQVADPAAAIYHYEQYLRLRPNAQNEEIVRQQIMAAKQELARAVWVGPISDKVQRELAQLTLDNKQLMATNALLTEALLKWQAYAVHLQGVTSRLAAAASVVSGPLSAPAPTADPGRFTRDAAERTGNALAGTSPSPLRSANAAVGWTHTVKAGETLSSIAREYGVRLPDLLAANPRLEPRRMKVGQTVVIPAAEKR